MAHVWAIVTKIALRQLNLPVIGLFQLRRIVALFMRSLSFQTILVAIQVRPRLSAVSRLPGSQHAQTGSGATRLGGALAFPVTWWTANRQQPWPTCALLSRGKARWLIDRVEMHQKQRPGQSAFENSWLDERNNNHGKFSRLCQRKFVVVRVSNNLCDSIRLTLDLLCFCEKFGNLPRYFFLQGNISHVKCVAA